MRVLHRSTFVASLVLATCAFGCGDKTTATADGSASAASTGPKAPAVTPAKRIDPLVMKTYRADSCYFGTLSLKQARAAYLASLDGGEPSESKIPDFGAETVEPIPTKDAAAPTAAGSAAPSVASAAASAKPAAKPKTKEKAASSAAPVESAAPASSAAAAPATSSSAGRALADAMRNRVRQVSYERFARSCNVAAGLKEPASADLDPVLKEYSDFALPLAKTIAEANAYYQKGQYKDDGFAKGKEYHQKLVEGFGKLDAMQQKLGESLEKWKKATPVDTSSYSETQKLADAAIADARDALVRLDAGDGAAVKAALDKVEQAATALKKYADEHKDEKDPWASFVPPTLGAYAEQLRALADGDLKTAPPAKMVNAVTLFTRIMEANHRALTRKMAEGAGRALGSQRLIKPKLPAGHPQ
jgi:hypothetical protein